MNAAQRKVAQYLGEAQANEQALARVLESQIAVAPEGSYRSALESHLEETRDHAARVGDRLAALGGSVNPLKVMIDLAETVVGYAVAIGMAPFDLLRGSGGEEKVLNNVKDACASESREIATYTAIERLARSVGDDQTAELAKSIRADEEKMLERLLREIPNLTEAVTGADIKDDPVHEIAAVHVADPVRQTGKTTTDAARRKAAGAKRNVTPSRQASVARPGPAPSESAVASRPPDDHADLRVAAADGDGAAAFTLWERLRESDFAEAEGWLREAAKSGDVRGAHALGQLLWRERHEEDEAIHWLDRAAQADDPSAERDLGIVLRERGDLHGARHWLSRAADRDDEAREALAALGEHG